MKNSVFLKIILLIIVFIIIGYKVELIRVSTEELSIPSALGLDIEKKGNDILYKISISSYIFGEEQKTTQRTTTGMALSPGQARQSRQQKLAKRFVIGLEKVDIISEKEARMGIDTSLDLLFNNPSVNDTALMAVCSGNAEDIIKLDIPGYPAAGDYIEQMIKSSKTFNFYTNNYKIIDAFARVDAEGRNLTLPFIEITDEGLSMTGAALFKGSKMVNKININETKILNMLSENAGKGIISIQKNSDSYLDYYAKVNRKVKCTKNEDKYIFDIKLNFKGDIISNQYDIDIRDDVKEKEKIQKELEKKIENSCNEFINKMKTEYKVDSLDLGRIAAAKYGRDLGTDWNKVVSDSQINVKASVKILKQGRGDY